MLKKSRFCSRIIRIIGMTFPQLIEVVRQVPVVLLLFLSLLFIPAETAAQFPTTKKDTTKTDIVHVDFSDVFENLVIGKDTYRKLLGNVELRQDSVYLYCDTAIILNETQVTATGNVLIQHGDSISVFADSAFYDGRLKTADLYGEVVLLNNNQNLFTDSLHYDLNTRIASFTGGATMTNDTTQLTSRRGYYYVATKDIFFKDDVIVVNPDFSLKADTLQFNTETRIVTFLGPTLISTSEEGKIYCEGGYYDTQNRLAEFTQKPQYVKGAQKATATVIRYDGNKQEYTLDGEAKFEDGAKTATADIIRYDEKNDLTYLTGNAHFVDGKQDIVADAITYDGKRNTYLTKGRSRFSNPPQILEADQLDYDNERGVGVATGSVVWRDTAQKINIFADQADYDKGRDYLKTKGGRPLMIAIVEGDSLFMRSDTLVSQRRDTAAHDSSRLLLAYHNVRIFKRDLQAVCDSLTYSNADSLFHFFQSPVIWSDTSQFTADTIRIRLSKGEIDRIFLHTNAFIINSPDEVFFNQIKGKNITAFFMEKELRRMLVEGNAESVYYALDDRDAYIGVNKTICSEMMLYFGNNKVEEIRFYAQPKADLLPMKQANHNELQMPGFRWITDARPKSKDDI